MNDRDFESFVKAIVHKVEMKLTETVTERTYDQVGGAVVNNLEANIEAPQAIKYIEKLCGVDMAEKRSYMCSSPVAPKGCLSMIYGPLVEV